MSEVEKLFISLALELFVIAIFCVPAFIFILNDEPIGILFIFPMMYLAPLAAKIVDK